ncbi:MAG TPA: preprotein translocase subunit SecY, partial [Planctomycetaceae bacterium]|nr:preprotein translocase subunit SecY [Planctomycetaceae bacterium]
MFSKLITVFRVPELRRKIFLTLGLLAVYRMGFSITLPFIDHSAINSGGGDGLGGMLQMVQVFSASNITSGSIFGLGIMPYITASIVFQLLGTVYPPLEALQKEGESGRRKINEYTRYATVLICMLQSFFLLNSGAMGQELILAEYNTWPWLIMGTLVMTTGTVFLMWIGEQIDEYGIGNGISLLIMAGILARLPLTAGNYLSGFMTEDGGLVGIGQGTHGIERLLVLAALFVSVIWGVVFITQGQRV